jgi:hypothetical protein
MNDNISESFQLQEDELYQILVDGANAGLFQYPLTGGGYIEITSDNIDRVSPPVSGY